MIKESKLTIIVLDNRGGVVFEHSLLSLIPSVSWKVINFLKNDEELTEMIKLGSLEFPWVIKEEYSTDSELLQKAIAKAKLYKQFHEARAMFR